MVKANAQSAVEEPEQRIWQQLGQLTIISSDQGTHLTAHSVQQWAERYPPQVIV